MSKTTPAKADTKPADNAPAQEQAPKKSKALTIVGIVMCVILVPILVINVTMVIQGFTNPDKVPSIFGYSPLMVLSGSMEDTIMMDDLIIIQSADAEDVQVNDIISFFDPESKGNAVETHRCVQVIRGSLNQPTLVIRPESDVHVKAVFKDKNNKTASKKIGATEPDASENNSDYYYINSYDDSVGGTIQFSTDKVAKGSDERFTITAVPNEGYVFDHWEFNGIYDRFEVINDNADVITFRTLGDNNGVLDTVYIPAENIIGKYQFRIPFVGKIAWWMQTTPGLIVCIAVPIILLVGYDLIMKKRYDKKKKKDTDALLAELEALRAQAAGNSSEAQQPAAAAPAPAPVEQPAQPTAPVEAETKPSSDPDLASVDALIDEITGEDTRK